MELTQMTAVIVAIGCATTVTLAMIRAVEIRIKLRRPPEEVLARRLAAGEITEAEYLAKLDVIEQGRALTP